MPDTSLSLKDKIIPAYARGYRELLGPMTSGFSPKEAREWFEERGVELKTEGDGRTFPVTDDSQTVIDCLLKEARIGGVELRKKCNVKKVSKLEDGRFQVRYSSGIGGEDGEVEDIFDSVVLATGSSKQGYLIARSLGHTIVPPVPSLFTLNCKEIAEVGQPFNGLAGTTTDDAVVCGEVGEGDDEKRRMLSYLSQRGPLLITHVGLPARLLSKLRRMARGSCTT